MSKRDEIKTAVEGLERRGRGNAYPKTLRDEIIAYTRQQREAGVTLVTIGSELGVPWRSLSRWTARVRRKRFARVELSVPVRALVVHGPHGIRIDGLDIDGVAELVRRLG